MPETPTDPFLGVKLSELAQEFRVDDYLKMYPDIADAEIDAFQHYIEHGWMERRRPRREFDPIFYSDFHLGGDIEICPLAHYTKFGRPQKLPTNLEQKRYSEWFDGLDEEWVIQFSGLMGALGYDSNRFTQNGLSRYLRAMFCPVTYRTNKNLESKISDNECFIQYLILDFANGISPGPLFDNEFYKTEIKARGLDFDEDSETPFEHWLRLGVGYEIIPNSLTKSEEYIALNADLKDYPGSIFGHLVLHGLKEGRQFLRDIYISQSSYKVSDRPNRRFLESINPGGDGTRAIQKMRNFRNSGMFNELVADACSIDPDVSLDSYLPAFMPPWHDTSFVAFKDCIKRIPPGIFKNIVFIPFCKVGGADYVSGILATALAHISGPVLVIQTDAPDWVRPDWFQNVENVDLSGILTRVSSSEKTRLLYEIIRFIKPENVFNVNSRATFETFVRFGRQLKRFTNIHCYYFCADRDANGIEVGYPVWYFSNLIHNLKSGITDSRDLADTLKSRYLLPKKYRDKVKTVYSPAMRGTKFSCVVDSQISNQEARPRPRLIWAGRFDKQKRFDILMSVASQMPDVDFLCWGKAVLDAPPDFSMVPENLMIFGAFKSYDELPLEDVDGFFYTSDWDGIPTILIELGAIGMPIIASSAGGVPELVNSDTGWPVPVGSPVSEYIKTIREFLDNPSERTLRAKRLQAYVKIHHSAENFAENLRTILKED